MSLLGPYLAGCLLLVGAGVAKAFQPGDTARALRAVVLPSAGVPAGVVQWAVRLLALGEAALGLVALGWPIPATAAAVAASYAAFAGFVVVARVRGGPLATCGCFGTPDTPPTRIHVAVDLGLAAAAGWVAAAAGTTLPGSPGSPGSPSTLMSLAHTLPGLLRHQPVDGVPLVGVSLVCALVLFLVLARLPRLQAVRATLQRPSVSRP